MLFALIGCFGLQSTTPKADVPAAPTLGAIELDAAALDFGTVATGDEVERVLTLSSASDEMVTVNALVDGDAAFSIPVDTLAVFEGDTLLTVAFAPEADGTYAGTLRLSTPAGDTADVTLAGIAGNGGGGGGSDTGNGGGTGAANLAVSTRSHEFGSVDVGATSAFTFTLRNDGGEPLSLSGIAASDAAFRIGGVAANATLDPGESGDLVVTFAPSRAQTYRGTVTVSSDDPDGDIQLSVSGTGATACTVCAPAMRVTTGGSDDHTMDQFWVFGSPVTERLQISNDGDLDLRVNSVSISNDVITPGNFGSDFRSAQTVAPGTYLNVNVTYTPGDGLPYECPNADFGSNILTISSNDPSEPVYEIGLGTFDSGSSCF